MMSRRQFLELAAALLSSPPGPLSLRERGNGGGQGVRLPLGFSTLGCPAWTWPQILGKVDSPAVQLLWDAHHTFVAGKEQPEDTVRQLGRYIRHTHLKDSVPAATAGGRRYVLTGTGEVPVRRQIEALVKIGYRGYYSFEWEKRWAPDSAEPEVAIAQFATVAAE